MAGAAAAAAREAAHGYLNLEMDLDSGQRSSRQLAIRDWVCRLTGAESATAVNNNAAATVIVLRALCRGKEVILSRGQLIEIGGSFRIPEIMAESGAILARSAPPTSPAWPITSGPSAPKRPACCACTPATTASPASPRLSRWRTSCPSAQSTTCLSSTTSAADLLDFGRFGFEGEPVARDSITAGADLVLFSGDKLLGGPQAGIIAGKKEWIQKIEKDPLDARLSPGQDDLGGPGGDPAPVPEHGQGPARSAGPAHC